MAEKITKTPEEREEARQTQLNVLKSNSLKSFVIANAGRDKARYGEIGEQATYGGYMGALSKPDEYLGQVLSNSFLRAEQETGEHYGGAVTPLHLLKTAEAFYFGGIGNLKVSDVLSLIGSKVSEEVISEEQRDMYMEDFNKENKDAYQKLISAYVSYTQMTGVGSAIVEAGKSTAGNLEKILMQKN